MENASKALIMAASILIGVMILSIAVTLFRTFSDFGHETHEKVEAEKLAQWNSTYLKYYGTISEERDKKTVTFPIAATAHDIITLANHARENNKKYELTMPMDSKKKDETSYYVQICIKNNNKYKHLEYMAEKEEDDKRAKNEFLGENSITTDESSINYNKVKYFKCSCSIENIISTTTGRVTYMEFEEFSEQDYRNLLGTVEIGNRSQSRSYE